MGATVTALELNAMDRFHAKNCTNKSSKLKLMKTRSCISSINVTHILLVRKFFNASSLSASTNSLVCLQMWCTWLAVLLWCSQAGGANVLMVTMGGTKSHTVPFVALSRALSARGHNMTLLSGFPGTALLVVQVFVAYSFLRTPQLD